MHKRICQVFTSLREHTCVSYAKLATIGGFCDIYLTIVKATSPDDFPLTDRYVHEFLKIFSISPASYHAFALGFTRRFSKTHSWRVALKCLVLLHRLLRSLPQDSPFRAELLWTRTNRLLSLYPCNFRDCSSSASEDYTVFIRLYARLLDEALDCISFDITERQIPCLDTDDTMIAKALEQMHDEESLPYKITSIGRMIETLPQLQRLIDRVIECWPTGAAARSFAIQYAMKYIIRDSFVCYTTYRREIVVILDNLIQLPYRSSLEAFGIYKKASIQAEELLKFHDCCKSMGYCGSYEYPFIDRIPEIQIRALETFLNGMWQLTDQSSSSNVSTLTSNVQSPLSLTDSDSDKRATLRPDKNSDQDEEKDMEMEPLIQWEVDNTSVGWEDLLEASINSNPCMDSRNQWLQSTNVYGYESSMQENGWEMQVYNPYVLQTPNPFYVPHRTNFFHGSCPTTPMHTWGL